ncbi:MAG: YbfB/YjiJ family MFS transporter [Betaproteobacteria bacterium]
MNLAANERGQALRIALTGLVCLAVAMGLGRFAFTPIMPMMLHDGLLTLQQASWLASSNYLGYLIGALACALQPWLWARLGWQLAPSFAQLIRLGLLATIVLTWAMQAPLSWSWAWLRFGAGLASALVFVYTSGWCLSQLGRLGRPQWAGAIYAGPGAGIVISGLAVSPMVAQGWPASWAWLSMALLAALGTALAWPTLGGPQAHLERLSRWQGAGQAAAAPAHPLSEQALTVIGYGLAGFGYIISATFLPVIARQFLPGSVWLDLFWPVFGAGVFTGALLSTRLPGHLDKRRLLWIGFLIQAAGLGLSQLSPSVPGFVLGSYALGLPFTAMSFFAMQEARRLRGGTAASFMGLLTATYGLGQVLGPLLVAQLLRYTEPARGFDLALWVATAALLGGALVFAGLQKRYPRVAVG